MALVFWKRVASLKELTLGQLQNILNGNKKTRIKEQWLSTFPNAVLNLRNNQAFLQTGTVVFKSLEDR